MNGSYLEKKLKIKLWAIHKLRTAWVVIGNYINLQIQFHSMASQMGDGHGGTRTLDLVMFTVADPLWRKLHLTFPTRILQQVSGHDCSLYREDRACTAETGNSSVINNHLCCSFYQAVQAQPIHPNWSGFILNSICILSRNMQTCLHILISALNNFMYLIWTPSSFGLFLAFVTFLLTVGSFFIAV